jgi:two-component system, chemotaxis family, protein-glutamate methylesterase/glutaminase
MLTTAAARASAARMADSPERDAVSTPPEGLDAEDPLASRFAGAESVVDAAATGRNGHYRDIVVIGASAGGVQALDQLVERLPPELPAAVFVVLHLSAGGRSVLPSILERMGPLPAAVPDEQQLPDRGHIYVAPPDRHLLLVGQEVRLTGGPRENGHRPAIDPLFRSAARTFGPRVIAVVLSGTLDDGAAGSRMVRDRGGVVIVQEPDDALYPDMPRNTLDVAGADAVLPAAEIAEKICELLDTPLPEDAQDVEEPEELEANELMEAQLAVNGTPTELACPDCGGALWEREDGDLVRFGCRVGHVYSPESLVAEHGKALEQALWAALRGLEERADLYRRMARRSQMAGRASIERRFHNRSESAERHATAIREAIAKLVASGDLAEEAS